MDTGYIPLNREGVRQVSWRSTGSVLAVLIMASPTSPTSFAPRACFDSSVFTLGVPENLCPSHPPALPLPRCRPTYRDLLPLLPLRLLPPPSRYHLTTTSRPSCPSSNAHPACLLPPTPRGPNPQYRPLRVWLGTRPAPRFPLLRVPGHAQRDDGPQAGKSHVSLSDRTRGLLVGPREGLGRVDRRGWRKKRAGGGRSGEASPVDRTAQNACRTRTLFCCLQEILTDS